MSPYLRVFLPLLLLSPSPLHAAVSLEDGIKSHLGRLTVDHLPGIAVLVARDGEITYQKGFGWADLAKKIPVTAETQFRIGSITKQFTAAAILRLAEDGKLTLTDPLDKYIPGFSKSITLSHLLTHTSGI